MKMKTFLYVQHLVVKKVLTLQKRKPVQILKIQNINPREVLRSQQISYNLDELLKSYKTKLIRGCILPLPPPTLGW